ncbi:hypothetical protein IV505_05015 [Pseudomonas fulva]|nr:hypothetical protein [Pseudomonas fulva]MBF8779101.1 hypothetical protein [Pseudomonas fulva]
MSNITLRLELDERQARHYLDWLSSQFDVIMAELWFSDRYRHVPCGARAPKVLADHPHLAGIGRTRHARRKQLAQSSESVR